jgi:AcrR family transcriptional regulator
MSAVVSEVNESVPNRDDPRFHRLLEATRRAARNGYESVSMRDLARETKMSLNTVYKFCGSKDQLIAEAHAERMDDFRAVLAERPPRGDTAEKRVKVVLRGIAGALERDDVMTRTLMRSIYSGGAGVAVARQAVTGSYHSMIDAAIGSEAIADRDAVIETLGHVINSVVINWLNNGWDAARISFVLADAARVLVGPRASGPPRIVRE